MNIFKSRAAKAFALAVALQTYVAGGLAPAAVKASSPAPPQQTQGRLTTNGDNPVSVNGNNARTGETIFSGQQIQTPAATGARVALPGLGGVDIGPASNVTLTFGDGRVNVVVVSGCVRLTVEAGVTGTVQSSGKTLTTDNDNRVIDTCNEAAARGAVPPAVPAVTAGGGLGTGTALALTSAVVGTFAVIANQLVSDSNNAELTDCTPIPGTTSPLTPPSGCTP